MGLFGKLFGKSESNSKGRESFGSAKRPIPRPVTQLEEAPTGLQIEVVRTDITMLSVDVIVNSASMSLSGGCGLEGAILKAVGPGLIKECRDSGGLSARGETLVTQGYHLSARHVIHVSGPVWRNGKQGEAEDLAKAYQNVIQRIRELGCGTVAIPCISCGNFGYPLNEACSIAVRELSALHQMPGRLRKLYLVAFKDAEATELRAALSQQGLLS